MQVRDLERVPHQPPAGPFPESQLAGKRATLSIVVSFHDDQQGRATSSA
jgi:hypothetical protein